MVNMFGFILLLLSVSSEGVIGAISPPHSTPQELCSECSGGCRTESKFFLNPILKEGYNYVDRIPKGACKVTIQQVKHTRNIIALQIKSPRDGLYFLNGPSSVGSRTRAYAAGTEWIYTPQDSTNLEIIQSPGPVLEHVDIMLLYNQPNPGIKYEYMMPTPVMGDNNGDKRHPSGYHAYPVDTRRNDIEARRLENRFMVNQQNDEIRPHRRRRRKFVWKIIGMTQCSKVCGGGVMHPMVTCVREHTQTQVYDRRCTGVSKPVNQTVMCNTHACPRGHSEIHAGHRLPGSGISGAKAFWGGTWSACSTTCGPGEQTRVPVCYKDNNPTHSSACSDSTPVTQRRCAVSSCDPTDNEVEQEPTAAQWHTGGWSQCSVTCGMGQRSRSVTCSGQCRPQDKPTTTEACRGPPCSMSSTSNIPTHHHHNQASSHIHNPPGAPPSIAISSHSQISPPSGWVTSEWSESCSEGCGTGEQTRWVACSSNGHCPVSQKLENRRACSTDRHCGGGRWYTGPWGPCGDNCDGPAVQKREVLCVARIRGQTLIVNDMTCPWSQRPSVEQTCEGTCAPRWHSGEWSQCVCPHGHQDRRVLCLDHQGRQSGGCHGESPQSRRNCQCSTETRFREMSQAQDEPSFGSDCVNTRTDCRVVVQSRLCQWRSYFSQCCASCRRAGQYPTGWNSERE